MRRETDIIEWAQARNILGPNGKATPLAQVAKTFEEVGELQEAIIDNDLAAIKDAIGDAIVTLVIQADMHRLTVEECVEAAWQQIKDRKGKMVDGQFVKEVAP